MKNSGGLRDVDMKIIKGNHTDATEVKETQLLKLFRSVGLKYRNLKIQPQRLIVQAPYDYFGRPLTQFTISSRLLQQLPETTQCAIESMYISNFVGFNNTNHIATLVGTIAATGGALARGNTFTFTGISFGSVVPSLYDYFTVVVTTTTGSKVNVMMYLSDVTNYATGSVVGTVIQPAYSTTGVQVSNQGYPTFPMGSQWASQQVAIDFVSYNATSTGFAGITNVNVELLGYTNPNVWDTGLGLLSDHSVSYGQITNNVGNYSNIIATVPCNRNTLSESCAVGGVGLTQLNFFQQVDYDSPAYSVKDPNLLNNSQLQFRLTYNQGGPEYQLPQPADNASIVPYNLANNFMGSTTGVAIPYNSTYDGSTWTAPSAATVRAGFTFAIQPIIRFTLVFYPLLGVEQIEE